MKKGYEALDAERCGGCRHFHRHYVKWGDDGYRPVDYGHCVYPRLKKRRTDETCPHWEAGEYVLSL